MIEEALVKRPGLAVAEGTVAHLLNPKLPRVWVRVAGCVFSGSLGESKVAPISLTHRRVAVRASRGLVRTCKRVAIIDPSNPDHDITTALPQSILQRAATLEARLNRYGLFHRALVLYVVTGLLVLLAWLRSSGPLRRSATGLLLLVWLVHTLGIVIRVYLSGRPPVTNLYSSAIFIGWGCVLLCLILEYLFRDGIGSVSGAATGFLTLLVAQGLSGSGDTMAVLQAVLDTNFWLATHVVVITLGYASTYLAGFLGVLFVLRGVFTRTLGKNEARQLAQRIYSIICFATLFSFVGTILGGIWADQSWGRFWGWDPKENGAMIIVLWNALVLHARWEGSPNTAASRSSLSSAAS